MNYFHRHPAIYIFVAAIFSGAALPAQTLDQIGVTALRAVATNVDGRGMRVTQAEASLTGDLLTWEVDPANVGQSLGVFNFISVAGTTNVYPNNLGTNSWHGEDVAGFFYGMPGGIATNIAGVDVIEANYFITNYLQNLLPIAGSAVVNQSFTFGNETTNLPTPAGDLAVSDQLQIDSAYDDYASQFKTLFIAAVNNGGAVSPPGTAYNCIGVAAYSVGAFSSVGPTLDNGRCKPDITAPAGYTSFSTPLVSGAVTVLMQAALRGDGGSDTNAAFDPRTIKALLLNGAVKPADWTNSNASPLDARYGSGVVNILNSYEQLIGGRRSNFVATTVSLGGAHPPVTSTNTVPVLSGWDFGTNTSSSASDAIKHYFFNVTNAVSGAKFLVAATLVWNRHQNKTAINNLNLFLYNCANSNLVACSTSRVDNVEHIYLTNLLQGRYDLQVWKAGGNSAAIVTTNEAYALAFEFVSPALSLAAAGSNVALNWPVYPAGFLVETETNLISPAWTTNNLPAGSVTNSRNYILLDATNANEFFRLRRPDF